MYETTERDRMCVWVNESKGKIGKAKKKKKKKNGVDVKKVCVTCDTYSL